MSPASEIEEFLKNKESMEDKYKKVRLLDDLVHINDKNEAMKDSRKWAYTPIRQAENGLQGENDEDMANFSIGDTINYHAVREPVPANPSPSSDNSILDNSNPIKKNGLIGPVIGASLLAGALALSVAKHPVTNVPAPPVVKPSDDTSSAEQLQKMLDNLRWGLDFGDK